MGYGSRKVGNNTRPRLAALATLVLLASIAAGGCAAHQALPAAPGQLPPAAVPALLAPDALAKGASAAVLLRLGREYDPACAQNISPAADNAQFTPTWADSTSPASSLAYGLYRLNLAGYSGAAELHCAWSGSPPPAGRVYVGLSNWVHNRWDWYSMPASGPVSLPGAGFTPYIDAGVGETLAVVLCLGQQQHVLRAMGVQAPPPLDYWPMYQHDAQHTGRSTHIGPTTNALKWKFEDQTGAGGKLSSPADRPGGPGLRRWLLRPPRLQRRRQPGLEGGAWQLFAVRPRGRGRRDGVRHRQ